MQVDYSKVIEEELPIYKKALANAFDYIRDKYPTLCFCGLKINLSSYIGQSHFRHCDKRGWSIKVHNRYKLYLYDRKNCGLKHPKGGITVSLELEATITLIHELTHYAQGVLGKRMYNEIDTTKNSIEYLKMYHPDIHRKLIKTNKPKVVRATPLEKIIATLKGVWWEEEKEIIDTPQKIVESNKLVAEFMGDNRTIVTRENGSAIIHHIKPKGKKKDEIRVDLSQFAGTYTLAEANIVTEKIKEKANTAIQNKLNPLLEKKKKWLSKLKRAENAIKKLDKSIKYYNKKLLK